VAAPYDDQARTATRVMKLDVVGLNYRLLPQQRQKLATMVERKPLACELEREPKNKYDKHAIKVNVNDLHLPGLKLPVRNGKLHIGYIRRGTAAVLAQGLDAKTLRVKSCRLTYVNSHGWGNVEVVFSKSPASKRKTSS